MPVNFGDAITITRYANGSYINGVYTAGAPSSVTVNGNIQSASSISSADQEQLNASQGRYTDGLICIRCDEQLYTDDTSDAGKADRLDWQGKTYEVIRAAYRGTLPALAHWKCFAQLVEVTVTGSAII